jgi:hypothetical protein
MAVTLLVLLARYLPPTAHPAALLFCSRVSAYPPVPMVTTRLLPLVYLAPTTACAALLPVFVLLACRGMFCRPTTPAKPHVLLATTIHLKCVRYAPTTALPVRLLAAQFVRLATIWCRHRWWYVCPYVLRADTSVPMEHGASNASLPA